MTIKEDINKLTVKDAPVSALEEQVPAQTIGSRIGVARFGEGGDGSEGGDGIDSPLTEKSRTIDCRTITIPYGVITVDVEVITQVVMEDASGREVVLNFSNPSSV